MCPPKHVWLAIILSCINPRWYMWHVTVPQLSTTPSPSSCPGPTPVRTSSLLCATVTSSRPGSRDSPFRLQRWVWLAAVDGGLVLVATVLCVVMDYLVKINMLLFYKIPDNLNKKVQYLKKLKQLWVISKIINKWIININK